MNNIIEYVIHIFVTIYFAVVGINTVIFSVSFV